MQYKKEAVRSRILEEGCREYLAEGYRSGNISRIAHNAGVPVGNLYRYFDGKAGLLEAIVKPAYDDIPHILEHLAASARNIESQMQLFEMVTSSMMAIYKTYGSAILILVDKCAGTSYEDFTDKLTALIGMVMADYLFKAGGRDDPFTVVVTKAFLNAVFDVFRLNAPAPAMAALIKRLLIFYFYDIAKRI